MFKWKIKISNLVRITQIPNQMCQRISNLFHHELIKNSGNKERWVGCFHVGPSHGLSFKNTVRERLHTQISESFIQDWDSLLPPSPSFCAWAFLHFFPHQRKDRTSSVDFFHFPIFSVILSASDTIARQTLNRCHHSGQPPTPPPHCFLRISFIPFLPFIPFFFESTFFHNPFANYMKISYRFSNLNSGFEPIICVIASTLPLTQ